MSYDGSAAAAAGLPDYDRPPVTEVVLGVQLRPMPIRAIDLGPLRQRWDADYPRIEEHPPLDPTPPDNAGPWPRINFGPPPMMRYWWISADDRRLIQIQQDRFIVNWRRTAGIEDEYPRYPSIRDAFEQSFKEFAEFARGITGVPPVVTQCETTYINDLALDGELPPLLSAVLRSWSEVPEHHLGNPVEAQFVQVFDIHMTHSAARLYVTFNPILRPDGTPSHALTLTVRGTPAADNAEAAINFFNDAREHIVSSFTELTTEPMHRRWGLR